jgi:hypothetical protein
MAITKPNQYRKPGKKKGHLNYMKNQEGVTGGNSISLHPFNILLQWKHSIPFSPAFLFVVTLCNSVM